MNRDYHVTIHDKEITNHDAIMLRFFLKNVLTIRDI